MSQRDLVVVAMPALNEALTVAGVVQGVLHFLPEVRIVVVDDGSSDATADIARNAGATVLRLPFNCGVGAALETAYRYAAQQGASAVVHVDADGQHNPGDIPRLLGELDRADVVVGSRFGAGGYRVTGLRRLSMALLSRTVTAIVGARITDATSGFRASGPRAIEVFARGYPAHYLGDTVESLVVAQRADLRLVEVPVTMQPRQGGRASHGTATSALHVGRAFLALFAAVSRPKSSG